MTRWPIVAGLLCVAACGEKLHEPRPLLSGQPSDESERGPALPDGVDPRYVVSAPCAADRAYTGPKVGDAFFFRLVGADGTDAGSMRLREAVTAVDGDTTTVEATYVAKGAPNTPPVVESAIRAVVPGATGDRRFRFETRDLEALRSLEPGRSVAMLGEESSTLGGTPRTVKGTWTVHWVGCGRTTAAVDGAPNQPVRVYRLTAFGRAVGSSGDIVKVGEIERVVSTRSGWKVLERTPTGELVLSGPPPAR